MELVPVIERLVLQPFGQLIDIGTAEGYYAVGFSLRMPQLGIIGYEADSSGRALLGKLATLNGVRHRIDIRGACQAKDLQEILRASKQRVLVICDVEGSESEILLSSDAAFFAQATLLVETHEFIVEGISENLTTHFSQTHRVRRINAEQRRRIDLPSAVQSVIWDRWTVKLLSEFRPAPMSWLVIEPKSLSSN